VASAGYVVWALRYSYLLASLLAATPLWRQFDPLAVLDVWDNKSKCRKGLGAGGDDDDDDSLESLLAAEKVRLAQENAMSPAAFDPEGASP
jgi:hypothetical protein